MWTRFFPLITEELLPRIRRGDIGSVVSVSANFGFNAMHLPASHRLFNPALGGGALLDIGIYPLSLASLILGPDPPKSVEGVAIKGETGVDIENSMSLLYGNGATANLACSLRSCTQREAIIVGTSG